MSFNFTLLSGISFMVKISASTYTLRRQSILCSYRHYLHLFKKNIGIKFYVSM